MKVEDILNEAWGKRAYPGKRLIEAGQHVADAVNEIVAKKFKENERMDFEGNPTGHKMEYWTARGEHATRWTRQGPGVHAKYNDPSASLRLVNERDAAHGLAGYQETHQKTTRAKATRRTRYAAQEMKKYLKQHGRHIPLDDTGMEQKDGYQIGKVIYVPGPYGNYVAMFTPNKLKGLLRQRPAEDETVAAGM